MARRPRCLRALSVPALSLSLSVFPLSLLLSLSVCLSFFVCLPSLSAPVSLSLSLFLCLSSLSLCPCLCLSFLVCLPPLSAPVSLCLSLLLCLSSLSLCPCLSLSLSTSFFVCLPSLSSPVSLCPSFSFYRCLSSSICLSLCLFLNPSSPPWSSSKAAHQGDRAFWVDGEFAFAMLSSVLKFLSTYTFQNAMKYIHFKILQH